MVVTSTAHIRTWELHSTEAIRAFGIESTAQIVKTISIQTLSCSPSEGRSGTATLLSQQVLLIDYVRGSLLKVNLEAHPIIPHLFNSHVTESTYNSLYFLNFPYIFLHLSWKICDLSAQSKPLLSNRHFVLNLCRHHCIFTYNLHVLKKQMHDRTTSRLRLQRVGRLVLCQFNSKLKCGNRSFESRKLLKYP